MEEIEFTVTVRQTAARDRTTGDEVTKWRVENEHMRPVQGDSAADALDILVECLESTDERVAVSVEELAGKNGEAER